MPTRRPTGDDIVTTTVNMPQPPDPSDLRVSIARMEEKLDSNLTEMRRVAGELGGLDARVDKVEDRVTAIETRHGTENAHARITALERRMWGWVGASALLSSGGAVAILQLISH